MRKYVYAGIFLAVASAIANAANTVPYSETFESYSAGFEMPGTNGWSAAASSNAVVSTDTASVAALNAYSKLCGYPGGTTSHAKVLEVDGTVSNSFNIGASQAIWADLMLQAGAVSSVDAGLLGTAHAAIYFNATGHPLVYHRDVAGGTNRWTEIPEVTKAGWVRATVGLDYQSDYFQIKLDGNLLTNALAWTTNDGSGSAGGSWFAMPTSASSLNELVFAGEGGDLDDLVVTTDDPFLPVIESFEHYSGNVCRMVVSFPVGNQLVLPSHFSPIKSTDLVAGVWDDTVTHSTNGVDGWLDTTLDYSIVSGSSRTLYLQAGDAAAFFGLEKN